MKRMITRTITETVGTGVVLDENEELKTVSFKVYGQLTPEKFAKAVLKQYNINMVKVKGVQYQDTKYSMPEADFIAKATVIED